MIGRLGKSTELRRLTQRTLAVMVVAAALTCAAETGCSRGSETKENAENEKNKEDQTAMTHDASRQTMPPGKNRLALEKSPYLLQHADNPVDWYPWGEEAFEKARREDKPIFLSIGYSTCHWCHVMERESFEDSTVAALMNDAFVCVKVDREERPDIDNIYMTACQTMTGSGGWPLSVIMTPDGKPFFIATYVPKTAAHGRAGMLQLIPQITSIWQDRRDEVDTASARITQGLQELFDRDAGEEGLGGESLSAAYEQLTGRFDTAHGGFGNAPKFPTPHNLLFLLRYWKRTGDAHALEMVEDTLDRMARGGIYDWIGFGFHRYSTDERWFAPHFEKMLYDQALLVMAYTEAGLATRKAAYRRIADEIVEYVMRDMTDPGGGFYSAEDADSEGIEGKFYLWTNKELVDLLGEEDGGLVADLYGVEPNGNFAAEMERANILHLRRPMAKAAAELNVSEDELRDRLEGIRQTLFAEREKRIRPHRDDKVLTDWNGLMIAALAKSARAFDNRGHAEAAEKAARFILDTMRDKDGRLHHRYRDGEAGIKGNVDDYAFLVWGLIELYETTLDVAYVEAALELTEVMERYFWDDQGGGFWFTPVDGEEMIARVKEVYDGAVPSGNSVAMLNLMRLGRLTADSRFGKRSVDIGRAFSEDIRRAPAAFSFLMAAVEFGVGRSREVIIVGEPESEDTRAMHRAINSIYMPNVVLLFKPAGEKKPRITQLAGYTASHTSKGGKATAYVCENYACRMPTTDIDDMLEMIEPGGD